jgi:membrane fusion protein, adhesin transport system
MKTNFDTIRPTGGYLLLGLLFFLFWASWFEIDQMVRVQGQVIPQEKNQIIQAADGGVIEAIHVNEGDIVKAGQVIASLERERAQAGVDEVRNRIAGLTITRLRAEAEASGRVPDFGTYNTTHTDLVHAQRSLYRQNIVGLTKDRSALSEQLTITQNEYKLSQNLYENGDISLVELMRTQRSVIDARQKNEGLDEKFKADARKELARIEDEITSQRSKLQERQSLVDHTEILAPVKGVVKSLRINTVGGVLRPGDEIMQISPTEGGYIIEAKLNPSDIGQLRLGLPASVKLDAFDYSIYGALDGELIYISSDTLTEQGQDGRLQIYYRVKIKVSKPSVNSRLSLGQIKAGMTASVDILTDKRTVLTYLTKPISRAFSGAFGQK